MSKHSFRFFSFLQFPKFIYFYKSFLQLYHTFRQCPNILLDCLHFFNFQNLHISKTKTTSTFPTFLNLPYSKFQNLLTHQTHIILSSNSQQILSNTQYSLTNSILTRNHYYLINRAMIIQSLTEETWNTKIPNLFTLPDPLTFTFSLVKKSLPSNPKERQPIRLWNSPRIRAEMLDIVILLKESKYFSKERKKSAWIGAEVGNGSRGWSF